MAKIETINPEVYIVSALNNFLFNLCSIIIFVIGISIEKEDPNKSELITMSWLARVFQYSEESSVLSYFLCFEFKEALHQI